MLNYPETIPFPEICTTLKGSGDIFEKTEKPDLTVRVRSHTDQCPAPVRTGSE